MVRIHRRAASAVLASVLLLATAFPGVSTAQTPAPTPPTEDPIEAAAGSLATALVDGERIETTFDGVTYPDQGLTADVVLALAASGLAADQIEAATDWLEEQAGAYTGTASGDVYAGAVAKLLIVTAATERPAVIGDLDLVATLESVEGDDGRFRDDSEFGDFSNVITQSLAVIGLQRTADTAPSDDAIGHLVGTACDDGGFPQDFPDSPADSPEDCTSDVDATTFAIQALLAVDDSATAQDAVQWLLDQQGENGGFGGAGAQANANSTGLAALALELGGAATAASDARAFVLDLQEDCTGDDPGAIRFSADDRGDVTRATAQALTGLAGVGLAQVDAGDAVAEVPVLDCPTRFSDVEYGSSVHAESILELTRLEVANGHADGTFGPSDAVTRGQFASWFAGVAEVDDGSATFDDVEGSVHAPAIGGLQAVGVLSGYGDGTFGPSEPVTRAHAAAIVARWLELEPVEKDAFVDISTSIHRTQINAAAQAGLIQGRDDGFGPQLPLRRDQAASLLVATHMLVAAS